MLGKTVKIRRCPATVSAPASRSVVWTRQETSQIPRRLCGEIVTTEVSDWLHFGKVAGKGHPRTKTCPRNPEAQVRRPVLGALTRLRSEGNEGASMPSRISRSLSARIRIFRLYPSIRLAIVLVLFALFAAGVRAASIRGVVTDTSGAKVKGANVTLLSSGKAVASAVSGADGSYEILTGLTGRFYILISAKSFRQLETPGFYAGRLDNRRAQSCPRARVGARVHRSHRHRNPHPPAPDQLRYRCARTA